MDKEKVIEVLECAKINTDNIKKVGFVMIEIVKEQINTAIKMLEEDEERSDT